VTDSESVSSFIVVDLFIDDDDDDARHPDPIRRRLHLCVELRILLTTPQVAQSPLLFNRSSFPLS
jgi:hypothetical protein